MKEILIRAALRKDVVPIRRILALYAKQKIVLPRTSDEISRHISNFRVAEKNGKVIGCCAYRDYGNGLFEIRSLAVSPHNKGRGAGTELVKYMIKDISSRGKVKIFALTTSPAFFKKFRFKLVGKEMFPQKIWYDCSKCPKLDKCDEEALLLVP